MKLRKRNKIITDTEPLILFIQKKGWASSTKAGDGLARQWRSVRPVSLFLVVCLEILSDLFWAVLFECGVALIFAIPLTLETIIFTALILFMFDSIVILSRMIRATKVLSNEDRKNGLDPSDNRSKRIIFEERLCWIAYAIIWLVILAGTVFQLTA